MPATRYNFGKKLEKSSKVFILGPKMTRFPHFGQNTDFP